MPDHSRFEELCALAAVGQISEAELADFQQHLQDCCLCQQLQSEFLEIGALSLSEKPEPDVYDPRLALRQSVLRNLQRAGAHFSDTVRTEIDQTTRRLPRLALATLFSPQPAWALVAAVTIVGLLGFGLGAYHHHSFSVAQPAVIIATAPSAPALQSPNEGREKANSELLAAQRTAAELQTAQAELQRKLASSEMERVRIQNELATLNQHIAALQNARNRDAGEIAQLKSVTDADHNAAQRAEAQLHKLQDAQSAKDADLVASQYRLRELEDKLAEQAAAAERDRQLMALASGSEIRDVIASRNLHIIDVADVDNRGTRKPFGRVFYTEGKSLIFYAYDLANTKGRQTFFAWGHREGDPSTTRPLGALFSDDQSQKRWVFKCNDAKVLAQIDSVYVTLEPNDRPGSQPRGKKLLNAYLGSPANHP